MKKKVLLVDDHPLMRKGIEQLLSLHPLFSEVIETDNGMKAILLAKLHNPDLVILDLNMKGLSGFDTLIKLKSHHPTMLVAILSVSDSKEDQDKLINAGANAFYQKDLDPEILLNSIVNLLDKKESYSALKSMETTKLAILTKRELQILHFVAKGWKNKQIAERVYISEATVKVHLKNILKKLNVDSRLSASLIYLKEKNVNM